MKIISGPVGSGKTKQLIEEWRKDPNGVFVNSEDINPRVLEEVYGVTKEELYRTIRLGALTKERLAVFGSPVLYIDSLHVFMNLMLNTRVGAVVVQTQRESVPNKEES